MRYLRVLLGGDGSDAEDIASETWLQIARDLGTFHGDEDGFRGWAATIARHRAMDHLRARRRRPTADLQVEELLDLPASDDTEGTVLAAAGTREALAMIATLPKDQAEAVLLRVVLQLDAESAAQVLGKRAGSVRMAAHRGLRKLAKLLEHSAALPPQRASARVPKKFSRRCDKGRSPDAEGHEMSTNRSRRIDRDAAEQLLSGATDGTQGGRDALAGLLAAASAPGTARELAGEEAALSAFREAARLAPAPQTLAGSKPRRRTMTDCAPARFLSVRVAAAALAATALGGVAVAAGTGNLPVVLGGSSGEAPAADGSPSGSSTAATASPTGHAAAPAWSATPSAGGSAPPGNLVALCRIRPTAAKAGADSRFDPLTRAAGGPDAVDAYCTDLLHRAGAQSDRPTDRASDAGTGTASVDGSGGDGKGQGSVDRSSATPTHPDNGADPTTARDGTGQGKSSDKPTAAPTDGKADHSQPPAQGNATASGHAKR